MKARDFDSRIRGFESHYPRLGYCCVTHDVFLLIHKPTSGRLLRIVTRSGGILWMVHSITVKTDTKEILSKCKVASAGSDAQSRCAWIVCKRVSKRSKKTGSALQGSSPCLSTLRKAIRSLGAGHRYVASRNDGEKLIFVVISKNVRQHSRLVANRISEVLNGFTWNAMKRKRLRYDS